MRKRFNPTELSLIAQGPGTPVEWRNVTQWHPAVIVGDIRPDGFGGQTVEIQNRRTTRTIMFGDLINIHPGALRARQDA